MLFHEIGVEPKSILELQFEPYLKSSFGLNKGLLISKFPRNWLDEVRQNINQLPDGIHKMKIKNLINNSHFMNLIVDFERSNPSSDWYAEAVKENAIRPFNALITKDINSPPLSFDVNHLHDLVDLSDADVGYCQVKSKSVADLCSELTPFLKLNKSLVLESYSQTLLSSKKTKELFENIFFKWKKYGGVEFKVITSLPRLKIEVFENECNLLKIFFTNNPFKGSFKFISVDDSLNKLHERYLLGPLSGIELGYGLETSTRDHSWKLINRASFINNKRRFLDADIRDEFPEYKEFSFRNGQVRIIDTTS
jgi:hypothetical protein